MKNFFIHVLFRNKFLLFFLSLSILIIFTFSDYFLIKNKISYTTLNQEKLNEFQWTFYKNNKKYNLYAVKIPNYTIFGDKEDRYIIFDGLTIIEGAGFYDKNERFRIIKNGSNYKVSSTSLNTKKIKDFYCDNWKKRIIDKNTIWTQLCKKPKLFKNKIVVNESGKIIKISQQITP